MRFKEYITELSKASFNLEQFASDCAPFLEAIRGIPSNRLPWHGTKNAPDDWKIGIMRGDREPRDSRQRLHDEVNAIFQHRFGWRAREHGMFICGHYSQALAYGPLTVLFPIGKFRSLWSPEIEDLTATFDASRYTIPKDELSQMTYDEKIEAQIDITTDMVRDVEWHFNTKLKEGLIETNEIIVQSDKFYQFKSVGDTFEDIVLPYLKKEGIVQ